MKIHFVYYLMDPDTRELLYVGRSMAPKVRKRRFISRTGRQAVFKRLRMFQTFEAAQQAELDAIASLTPPYNKMLVSGFGTIGRKRPASEFVKLSQRKGIPLTQEHRNNISLGSKGRSKSKEHAAKIAKALKGQTFTEQRCLNISQALKGKLKGIPKSPEHRAKLAACLAKGRETMRKKRE